MGYGVGLQEVRTFSFFLHRCNEDISCLNSRPLPLPNIIKIKIHSSCKIEDFIESHYWVCGLIKDTDRRLPYKLRCRKYQGQQGDVSQSVRYHHRKTRLRRSYLCAVCADESDRICVGWTWRFPRVARGRVTTRKLFTEALPKGRKEKARSRTPSGSWLFSTTAALYVDKNSFRPRPLPLSLPP